MNHPSSRRGFIKKTVLAATGVSLGVACGQTNSKKNTSAGAQQTRREQLYGLLCDLPPRDRAIGGKVMSVESKNGYKLEKLLLDLNGQQPVPAWFASPENVKGPMPAILFSHSHGGNYKLGKDELIKGNTYMPELPYVEALTKLGFCVLSIDHWVFGERSGRTELEVFKETLWLGKCLWGMMVYDSLRAMDYLCQRPETDASRIGAIGMSMGSTMTWWLSALDTRIKACADICCLTYFDSSITEGSLNHGIYYYVPSLLKYFSTIDINALIAPRAHLSIAGSLDSATPAEGLNKIDKALKEEYGKLGAADKWKLNVYDNIGHFETAEMRKDLLDFLEHELKQK